MSTLTYDFESDAVGATPVGWSYQDGSASAVVAAPGDNVWNFTPGSGTSSIFRNTEAGQVADVIASGVFSLSETLTTAVFYIRHNGLTGSNRTGYWFSATPSALSLFRGDVGSSTQLATSAETHTVDTEYNFKIEATGTTIRVKTWSGSEPAWILSEVDATYSSGYVVAASVYNLYYDDIVIESDEIEAAVNPGTGAVVVSGYDVLAGASVQVTTGALVVAGSNLVVGKTIAITATTGAVVVAGFSANNTGVGAIVIAGSNPVITGTQPQYTRLKFKFKNEDGAIKEYEIDRRPVILEPTTVFALPTTDGCAFVNATAGSVVANVPTAVDRSGLKYTVSKTDSSSNTVTVTPAGAETINGDATFELVFQDETVTFVSTGSNWRVI